MPSRLASLVRSAALAFPAGAGVGTVITAVVISMEDGP